jgi:hypothetical protein
MDNKAKTNEKNYYLVVSKSGCVMECWAENDFYLFGIKNIYDDNQEPHPVSFIVNVANEEIIDMEGYED